jgi:hypothetical protein
MELKHKQQLIRRLFGYFIVDGYSVDESCVSADCYISDWYYFDFIEDYLDVDGTNEYYQIAVPLEESSSVQLKSKFLQQGNIPIGIFLSFNLNLEKRAEKKFPEYINIPIYAVYQKDGLFKISIEQNEWIPSLNIPLNEDEEERVKKQTFPLEIIDLSSYNELLSRKLFGYVTTNGGIIIICSGDPDFLYLCRKEGGWCDKKHQIIVSGESEENKGFRVAVMFHIPEEIQDREFPVYGEYEGDFLKRIVIEIASGEEGKKVWDYNFSDSNESIAASQE